jgi:hypothetical protein
VDGLPLIARGRLPPIVHAHGKPCARAFHDHLQHEAGGRHFIAPPIAIMPTTAFA